MREKPDSLVNLEAAYGEPSQAGFGSAVFFESLKAADDLETIAIAKYRYFVGELWERYGEEAWMGPWKEVYARSTGGRHDIVAELRGIQDREAALSLSMILDNIDNPEQARVALVSVFDDLAMTEVRVYNLGDGGAMSGILIAGQRSNGETIFLLSLLD